MLFYFVVVINAFSYFGLFAATKIHHSTISYEKSIKIACNNIFYSTELLKLFSQSLIKKILDLRSKYHV